MPGKPQGTPDLRLICMSSRRISAAIIDDSDAIVFLDRLRTSDVRAIWPDCRYCVSDDFIGIDEREAQCDVYCRCTS